MSFTAMPAEAAACFPPVTHDGPHSFASLDEAFFTRQPAAPLPSPYLVGFSSACAELLGWPAAWAEAPDTANAFVEYFAGNSIGDNRSTLPLATVYSGHQFGTWAGQLGDGRALLLGETEHRGRRYELQLKGAGMTPYSRMGDGRAVLRSSIREFLASEAMHALGVPTTRALCVIGSDLPVRRETMESAAVVTRVAESFVRIGHFEHFYAQRRYDLLRQLADHVIDRLYPDCRGASDPYLALLEQVTLRTADLLAQWQAIGFCHGVMNTDNMSIAGLTIDYGPYGFLDGYDPGHICNHSDQGGRYAYDQQPQVAYWNLFCLAQAMLPLLAGMEDGADEAGQDAAIAAAQDTLARFQSRYHDQYRTRMRAKFGLFTSLAGDEAVIEGLFALMQAQRADFTLTFRRLAQLSDTSLPGAPPRDLFIDRAAFDVWAETYQARLQAEPGDPVSRAQAMNRVNPKYVLRNHLAEQAIRRAHERDYGELARLSQVLRRPYDEQPEADTAYGGLPPDWAGSLEVSCSS